MIEWMDRWMMWRFFRRRRICVLQPWEAASCGLAWRVAVSEAAVTPRISRPKQRPQPAGWWCDILSHVFSLNQNAPEVHSHAVRKGSLTLYFISNYKYTTDAYTVNQRAGNNDHCCVATMVSIKATFLMEHTCVSGIICCGLLWSGNVCGLIRAPTTLSPCVTLTS